MGTEATAWRGPAGRWGVVALASWAVVLAGACAWGVAKPNSHNCYLDYYQQAGRNWAEGRDLYGAVAGCCRYSPLANALLAPPSLAPLWLGALVWRLANAATLLGAVLWWLRACTPSWPPALRAGALLALLPLSVGNIFSAQANPLVIGLLLATTAAAVRGRWNLAAAFCAGACLLKVYPVAVALLLAAAFPRRFGWRFLIALAAGLALPFLLQRPDYVARQYALWLGNLREDDRSGWDLESGYRDLWLLIRLAHLPLGRSAYLGIQLLIAALAGAVCLAGRWLAGWRDVEVLHAALHLGACWMTLCGPATEGATYLLAAPTLAWAVAESWRRPRPWWTRGLLLAAGAAALAALAASLVPHTARITAYGLQPLGVLLLFAGLTAEYVDRLATPRPRAREGAAPRAVAA